MPVSKRKSRILDLVNRIGRDRLRWIGFNSFFYDEDRRYMRFLVPRGLRVDRLRTRLARFTPQRVFLLLCLEVWSRVTLDRVDPRTELVTMTDA